MQTRTRFAALLAVGALAALPAASEARVSGHAWNTGPGQATTGECQGYAGAFNELAAQSESGLLAGDSKKSDEKGKLATGVLKAGQARGCTFLPD